MNANEIRAQHEAEMREIQLDLQEIDSRIAPRRIAAEAKLKAAIADAQKYKQEFGR